MIGQANPQAIILDCKGDLTRNDSQRRFLAQHSVEILEQYCNYSKQCRNNVATLCCAKNRRCESSRVTSPPGGALGQFLGGYVPPGTPNLHPVLKQISPKIDTPFQKWANFLFPVLELAVKLIPRSRNGPIFYTSPQKVCNLKQPCFFKIFPYLFDLYIK